MRQQGDRPGNDAPSSHGWSSRAGPGAIRRRDTALGSQTRKGRRDALKTRDVEAALIGMDVVIQTLGVGLGDLFRPVRLFSDATRVLLPAMKAKASNV